MKFLSVVIPNYNGASLIPRFMPSVLRAVRGYGGRSEVIFVDDASGDDSVEIARGFPELQLVLRPENGGFPAACNSGLEAARGEIIFFLNTDVELAEDFFSTFSTFFDRSDTFAVTVHGRRYGSGEPLDGIKLGEWKRGNLRVTRNIFPTVDPPHDRWYRSFAVQGAYFFADAGKLRELHGFDELFSPYIFEETDLSYRALLRDWKIYYDPHAIAIHDHSSTLKSTASQRRIRRISLRNRLIFTWKNIHSVRLLCSHFFFLGLKLLSLNPLVWGAFREALDRLPSIRQKRSVEKAERVLSDQEILRRFRSLEL